MVEDTPEDALSLARDYCGAGRFSEAAMVLQRLVKAHPRHAGLRYQYGLLLAQLGKYEGAIQQLRISQRADPANSQYGKGLAEALECAGRVNDALAVYREVLRIAPNWIEVRGGMANLLQRAGQLSASEHEFRVIIEQSPSLIAAWVNLGNVLQECKRDEEAIECFRHAIQLQPDVPEAHYNLGNALRVLLKYEEAIREFECAIALRPTYKEAYINLGNMLCECNRPRDAIPYYRRLLALDSTNVEVRLSLGEALQSTRNWEDAESAYRHVLSLVPNHQEVCKQLALLLHVMHRPGEAAYFFRQLLVMVPDAYDVWNYLAMCYLAMAHSGDEHFSRSLEGIAGQAELIAKCPRAAIEEALRCSERAMEVKPNDPLACLNKAGALGLLGRFDEAVVACRTANAIKPDFLDAHFDLALLLLSRGQYLEGWKEYSWRLKITDALDYLSGVHGLPPPLDMTMHNPPINFEDKRILIAREQGIGDEIFFLRFLPALYARGARIAYWPTLKIRSLLERVKWIDTLVDDMSVPTNIDMVIAAGDLPYALADPSIFPPLALLPLVGRVQALRETLESFAGRPLLGVTWRAGPTKQSGVPAGLHKEIAPGVLGRCIAGWEGEFVVVQRDLKPGEIGEFEKAVGRTVINLSELNEDLEGMLALLSLLDEYVGVSNANMHLRAGLALPARVLVSHPAEWRWMTGGESSPWFPRFSLYRESLDKGWDEVLRQLAQDIGRGKEGESAI